MMLLVLGGVAGSLLDRSFIWFGASIGAGLGIWGGSWIALGLTDLERTRVNMAACSLGALAALLIVLSPVILARSPIPMWSLVAILAPGLGAGFAMAFIESRRVPKTGPSSFWMFHPGQSETLKKPGKWGDDQGKRDHVEDEVLPESGRSSAGAAHHHGESDEGNQAEQNQP